MPTYEYRCDACGHRLEVVQRFSDEPLTTCSECGGALKRVFHPVGVVLKGSGFYATDSRSNKALKPGSKSESSPEKGSSSSEKGSSSTGKGSSSTTSGSDS